MSVSIEEITAQVEPPQTPAAPASHASTDDQPDALMRRQCDLLARVERRADRLRAD